MWRFCVYLAGILFISFLIGCGGTSSGLSARPASRQRTTNRPASNNAEKAYDISKLNTIAFLGLSSSVQAKDVVPQLQPVLEDLIMATEHPFVVLDRNEVNTRVRREKAQVLFDDVIDFWMDKKKVDTFKVSELCKLLMVDGILIGNITEWMQSQAAFDAEDASYTQISTSLSIYLGETGREIWNKTATKILEAEKLDSRTDQVDLSGGGGAAGRGMKARKPGDPPKYDRVIPYVAEELAKALK
jgi:hypothetical protein